MGLFDYFGGARYPHTNWNILNLDWIMEKIRALTDSQGEVTEAAQAATTAANNANSAATSARTAAQSATTAANNATAAAQRAEEKAEAAVIDFAETGELTITPPEGVIVSGRVYYALSTDKRFMKIYTGATGSLFLQAGERTDGFVYLETNLNVGARDRVFNITGAGVEKIAKTGITSENLEYLANIEVLSLAYPAIQIASNGQLFIRAYLQSERKHQIGLYPCIYQLKDFGDT